MNDYLTRLRAKGMKSHFIEMDGRVSIDHADSVKSADYYIGSWLIAKKPVSIYSNPNGGTLLGSRKVGESVGRIYSYVQDNNKQLWWMLDTQSGGGFVKHETGAFDNQVALDTSDQKITDDQKKIENAGPLDGFTEGLSKLGTGLTDAVGGVGSSFSTIGKNLPIIIGAIVALMIVTTLLKAKSVVA